MTGRSRPSDALVLFGATGDLATQEDLPGPLRDGTQRPVLGAGHRRVVVGVDRRRAARAGARVDRGAKVRRRRAPCWKELAGRLTYVSGDYRDDDDLRAAGRAPGQGVERPLFYLAIPPAMFDDVVAGPGPGRPQRGPRPGRGREAVRPRPRVGPRAQRRAPRRRSPRSRSTASTTSSGRSPSRTCWSSGSPTRCSSRCGTARTSPACRSRWPRSSGSRAAASSTSRSARCATSCRTTCCRCSPCWPWSRRCRPTTTALADEQVRLLRQVKAVDPHQVVRGPVPGLRRRGRGRRRQRHRDLRGPPARDRVVALGGRAVAGPHRQVPAGDGHRGGDHVRGPAPPAVRPGRVAAAPAQPAAVPPRRRRRGHAAGPGQDARRRAQEPAGRPRRLLRLAVPRAPGGVPAAAGGRHGGRPPPLRPGRLGRGAVADRRAAARRPAPGRAVPPGHVGPGRGRPRWPPPIGGWVEPLADG